MKHLPSGSSVTEFGLGINESYKNKQGEKVETAVFVDCVAFGKTGELIAQYLQKGSPIFVEGKLKLDQWEDRNGGGKRSKLRVVVDQMQFLGGKGEGGGDRKQPTERRPAKSPADSFYDDASLPSGSDEVPF